MTAQARKSVSYLAAFLVSAALLFGLSNLPKTTLAVLLIGFALLWGAMLVLTRHSLAPVRGPLKAIICCILLAGTTSFIAPGTSEFDGWAAAVRYTLMQGNIWYLVPSAAFAGACLLSLNDATSPKGRVVSCSPDLAFGLTAMALFYLALRPFPNIPQNLPALWGHTLVHYLILWAFFCVASYITRCFLAIAHRQAGDDPDHAGLLPGEQSLRRFMRVVISTLPLLGFLGTVLGITQALSGLPTLIGGDGALTQNTSTALGTGLASIAIAFETTMLGLITSLIATVSLSYAEKLESDLDVTSGSSRTSS